MKARSIDVRPIPGTGSQGSGKPIRGQVKGFSRQRAFRSIRPHCTTTAHRSGLNRSLQNAPRCPGRPWNAPVRRSRSPSISPPYLTQVPASRTPGLGSLGQAPGCRPVTAENTRIRSERSGHARRRAGKDIHSFPATFTLLLSLFRMCRHRSISGLVDSTWDQADRETQRVCRDGRNPRCWPDGGFRKCPRGRRKF